MTTLDVEWYQSQKKRLGREQGLLAIIGVIFGILDGLSNWPIILLIAALLLIGQIRRSAVNTENRVLAEDRLSKTSPLLVLGSLTVVFYIVAHSVTLIGISTTLIGKVSMFSVLCLSLGVVIMVIEHYSNGQYLNWWSERAIERAHKKQDSFWLWIAGGFMQISPTEISAEEMERNNKKRRARQRLNPGPFKASASASNPPSFKIAYFLTLIREMVQWKRSLPIITATLFIVFQGTTVPIAILGALLVWLGSSVLADHIKYWYFFRPVQDGFMEEPEIKTLKHRILYEGQSYWVSNVLAIFILWKVF